MPHPIITKIITIMAAVTPKKNKNALSVDAVLTPHERTRHLESLERGALGEGGEFFEEVGSESFTGVDSPTPSLPQAARRGVTKSYVAGLWIALGLTMLALCGVAGFTIFNDITKTNEQQKGMAPLAGAISDSTSAVDLALKAQERLTALNASLAQVQAQQAAFQTQQTELLTKLQEDQKAHSLALCSQLVGKDEEAAEGYRTEFVCQAQTGWQLSGCPGKAVVVQALLGRFTSAPDGPCTDRGSPTTWRVESCPTSMDLTTPTQEALAQAKGGPVMDTPMQLLQRGGLRVDACPRSYKQLQVVYRCPQVDSTARTQRCVDLLNQPAAAVPEK